MDELKKYVDELFKKYNNIPDIENLKSATLKKLTKKQVSYMKQGLNSKMAIEKAKTTITEIDHLIPNNIKVCQNQYKVAFLQHMLLYLLIGWVILLPSNIISEGLIVQTIIVWGILICGVIYLWIRNKHDINFWNKTTYYPKDKIKKIKKYSWYIYLAVLAATIVNAIIAFRNPTERIQTRLSPMDFNSIVWIIYHFFSPFFLIVYPIGIEKLATLLEKKEHKINRTLEFVIILLLVIITVCFYMI